MLGDLSGTRRICRESLAGICVSIHPSWSWVPGAFVHEVLEDSVKIEARYSQAVGESQDKDVVADAAASILQSKVVTLEEGAEVDVELVSEEWRSVQTSRHRWDWYSNNRESRSAIKHRDSKAQTSNSAGRHTINATFALFEAIGLL